MENNTVDEIQWLESQLITDHVVLPNSFWSTIVKFNCRIELGLPSFVPNPELPAGIATFSPTELPQTSGVFKGDLNFHFDFENPKRIVGADIPAGWIEFDEVSGITPEEEWLDNGEAIDWGTKTFFRLAFGDDNIRTICSGSRDFIGFKHNASIEAMGRIARIQSFLKSKRMPLDGFWALEVAFELNEIVTASGRKSEFWVDNSIDPLLESSLPAISLMREDWLSWLSPNTAQKMRPLFLFLDKRGHKDVGTLMTKLVSSAEED